MPDVIVIGAGVNGLVAAGALAIEKFSPLVIERQAEAGGAMAEGQLGPGLRSPTRSTAPTGTRREGQSCCASSQ